MSEIMSGIPEIVDPPGWSSLDERTKLLNSKLSPSLGPPDICRITKILSTKKSVFSDVTNVRCRYTHHFSMEISSMEDFQEYLETIIDRVDKGDGWKSCKIESVTFAVFDIFSKSDFRIQFDLDDEEISSMKFYQISSQSSADSLVSLEKLTKPMFEQIQFSCYLRYLNLSASLSPTMTSASSVSPCLRVPRLFSPWESYNKLAGKLLGSSTEDLKSVVDLLGSYFVSNSDLNSMLTLFASLQSAQPSVIPWIAKAYEMRGQSGHAVSLLLRGKANSETFRFQARLTRKHGNLELANKCATLAFELDPENILAILEICKLCLLGERDMSKCMHALNYALKLEFEMQQKNQVTSWQGFEQTANDEISDSIDPGIFNISSYGVVKNYPVASQVSLARTSFASTTSSYTMTIAERRSLNLSTSEIGLVKNRAYPTLKGYGEVTRKAFTILSKVHKLELGDMPIDHLEFVKPLREKLQSDFTEVQSWRLDDSPCDGFTWMSRAMQAERIGDWRLLEKCLNRIQSQWNCPRAWYLLGKCFYSNEDIQGFLTHICLILRKYQSILPGYFPPWMKKFLVKWVARNGFSYIVESLEGVSASSSEKSQILDSLKKIKAGEFQGSDR
jgi:hypothetical protein